MAPLLWGAPLSVRGVSVGSFACRMDAVHAGWPQTAESWLAEASQLPCNERGYNAGGFVNAAAGRAEWLAAVELTVLETAAAARQGGRVATLHQKIVDTFLAELADSPEIDAALIQQLRRALSNATKPKVDELVRIFSQPAGGDLE